MGPLFLLTRRLMPKERRAPAADFDDMTSLMRSLDGIQKPRLKALVQWRIRCISDLDEHPATENCTNEDSVNICVVNYRNRLRLAGVEPPSTILQGVVNKGTNGIEL